MNIQYKSIEVTLLFDLVKTLSMNVVTSSDSSVYLLFVRFSGQKFVNEISDDYENRCYEVR